MRHILGTGLALVIAASVPTLSQAQQQDTDTQRMDQRGDRDDHGEWGWLGLLGLAGLIGLKRKDRYEDVRHGQTAAR
jgi:hypothetical protein